VGRVAPHLRSGDGETGTGCSDQYCSTTISVFYARAFGQRVERRRGGDASGRRCIHFENVLGQPACGCGYVPGSQLRRAVEKISRKEKRKPAQFAGFLYFHDRDLIGFSSRRGSIRRADCHARDIARVLRLKKDRTRLPQCRWVRRPHPALRLASVVRQ